MDMDEYLKEDLTGLTHLVATKQVSAMEVLEATIAREAAVNPALNAIAQCLHDHGRTAIEAGCRMGCWRARHIC